VFVASSEDILNVIDHRLARLFLQHLSP